MFRLKSLKPVLFVLTISLVLSVAGCGSPEGPEMNSDNPVNTTEITSDVYNKAIEVLDEMSEDQRVKDFRVAYDLLMSIPSDEDGFIKHLDEANTIFEKYDVEFKYGRYFLRRKETISITKDEIEEYRNRAAYYDANELLNGIMYPALFDLYGYDALRIEGITATNVIAAIESTNEYLLDSKEETYDGCTETWEYIGTVKSSRYQVKYHANGLVESINIPIIRHNRPMDEEAFKSFFDFDLEEQKQIAGKRFATMMEQFDVVDTGYEVLSQIYSDEEISIIHNYIKSLAADDIWERNMWAYGLEDSEPTTYAVAAVSCDYKGNSITIHYGLNEIHLRVIGRNSINYLTSKWYTLYQGLVVSEGSDNSIDGYKDYIDYNPEMNSRVEEWSYDLNANESKYVGENNGHKEDVGNPNEDIIVLTVTETESVSVEGIVEQNTTAFPQYCLKLSVPISVSFKDYREDHVFRCDYLYFYNEAEINGGYDFSSLVGRECSVTATLYDYRGGGNLFLSDPTITVEE